MSVRVLAMSACDRAKRGEENVRGGLQAKEKNKVAPTYSTVLLAHGEVAPVLLDRRTEGTKKTIVINDIKNQ